jgi:hypothetical protein
MKRSEVLNLIRDTMRAEEGKAIHFREMIDNILPEKILRTIEEAGMIPPAFTERMSCGCCSSYQEGEWEKE